MSFLNPGEPEVGNKFYRTIYHAFGLPASYRMPTAGTREIKMGWDFKTLRNFTITGKNIVPHLFIRRGPTNLFESIEKELPPHPRYEWAFDTSLLSQGQLKGKIVVSGTKEKTISDAYRTVLYAIGDSITKRYLNVPAVRIHFGSLWDTHSIPEVISVDFQPTTPMEEYHMAALREQLAYVFNLLHHEDIHGEAVCNIKTNQFEMRFKPVPQSEKVEETDPVVNASFNPVDSEPVVHPHVPAPPTHAPASAAHSGFPFDFYRGLGLIDGEGYVEVPTILGPMKVHCSHPEAIEHLMGYQPK